MASHQGKAAMDERKPNADVLRRSSRLLERATMSRSRPEATLLGIPTEIRIMIYGHLLSPPSKNCHLHHVCNKTKSDECTMNKSRIEKESRGYLALLLTCSTIYTEAADTLYKPIIRPGDENCTVPRIFVSSDGIGLRNFPGMFCRNHLVYRDGATGVFRRIESLNICVMATLEYGITCACCGGFHPTGEEDNPPWFGLDDKNQVTDNVRWLAEQLRHSGTFRHLEITVDWSDEVHLGPPELGDSAMLLKPFKALRNVKDLKIPSLGTIVEFLVSDRVLEEDVIEDWEKVVSYKKKMRDILGSNAPVRENPIPLSTWLSFKQTVRRLMGLAPQIGAEKYLRLAVHAMNNQDKTAFQKHANSLFKAWKEDKKQRQKIDLKLGEIHQANLLDIPAGKRQEDDPEGMDFSKFSWFDPGIDKEDRATYIEFLERFNDPDD